MGCRIRDAVDFLVHDLAILIKRQRQREERPGRLDFGSGDGVVAQRICKSFPQHFIDIHARAIVGGGGVGQQDEGLRGAAVVVQVIAQGVGAAAEHQCVFLIGIEAGLGGVILHINATCLLGGAEIAGADAGGDHYLRGADRILHGVAAHL